MRVLVSRRVCWIEPYTPRLGRFRGRYRVWTQNSFNTRLFYAAQRHPFRDLICDERRPLCNSLTGTRSPA